MLRSIALRAVVTALLSTAFVAAPVKIGFATTPQDAQQRPEEKTYTPEQRFERRYPQAVKVGHLIGLPVLDDRDSTYGYIRAVVRGGDGKFHLIVPYRGWLGWAPTDRDARPSRFRLRRWRSWRAKSSRSTSSAICSPRRRSTPAPTHARSGADHPHGGVPPVRVLLTGGAGFIGQHVLRELLLVATRCACSIRCGPTCITASPGLRPPAPNLLPRRARRGAIDRALLGVDAVLHLAAKVGLGVDVSDLPDYASSNDAGTAELLAGMARAGVARLTLGEFDGGLRRRRGALRRTWRGHTWATRRSRVGGRAVRAALPALRRAARNRAGSESAPLDPRNAYASSKVAQEFYAANWARATGGAVAAMRYHNVYGPGMPRDTPYAGVAAIFTSALRRGEAPKVFEDGGQRRDFVHVRDVAGATVRPASSMPQACARSMSARARRAPSATWRAGWRR